MTSFCDQFAMCEWRAQESANNAAKFHKFSNLSPAIVVASLIGKYIGYCQWALIPGMIPMPSLPTDTAGHRLNAQLYLSIPAILSRTSVV
jgi:hypothetical protein